MSEPTKQSWMKFYPTDWRADAELRMCGLAARGLWVEMISIMHAAETVGSLLVNGRTISARQLAMLAGATEAEVSVLLAELEDAGVFSRDGDGTIYSRRMRRDVEKAVRDRNNGKGGGNPNLTKGVNPPLNPDQNLPDNGADKARARVPEARVQTELASASSERANAKPNPIRDALLAGGLTLENADAVIAHRKAKRAALTVRTAELLVKAFNSTADPNAAAELMMVRGWQGFDAGWPANGKQTDGRNGNSVQAAAQRLVERGVDFGPVPEPYVLIRNRAEAGGNPPRLLPEGGRGGPGDVRGGSGVDPELLPPARSVPGD